MPLATEGSQDCPHCEIFHFSLFTFHFYRSPMQLVAPRAVSTAEIIEASICSDHLSVSFFVIIYKL